MTTRTSNAATAERDEKITSNLPLVRYCVNGMHLGNVCSALEYEDLVGHGTLGLIQATDRFDGSKGVKFSNFAATRIRGAVLDAMRTLDPVGRTTRHVGKKITEEFNALSLELGRTPTAAEVQSRMGVGEAQYWSARRASGMRLVSIDVPFPDGTSLADRMGDPGAEVSTGIETRELSQALADAIALLPGRDRLVLSLYFVEGLTMANVARAMDISETRVSQLLQRVYSRLRTNRNLVGAAGLQNSG